MRPITRRDALVSLSATLAWPTWSLAQDQRLERFSFVVVSDTHIGRNDSQSPQRFWAQTAKEVEASPGDFVLHLGDVVDGQRGEAYGPYLEARRTIRKPVHEVPGNHDPVDHFTKQLGIETDRSFDHKGVRFILLNNSHNDSHDGFLTHRQLRWMSEQCQQATQRDLLIVFAMHVPVHTNRAPDRGWYVKPKEGQTEFYALLERHKTRVLAVLHGHFHNGIRGWNDNGPFHEVLFPSALYNQDRGLAERKAPGYYLGEFRPGFTKVELTRQAMTLRYQVTGVDASAEQVCRFM